MFLISDAAIGFALSSEYSFGANNFCRSFASVTSNIFFRIMASYSSWVAFCQFTFSGLFHSFPVRQRASFRAHQRLYQHRGTPCVSVRQQVSIRARQCICYSSCFDAFFLDGASLFVSSFLCPFGLGFRSLSAACSCLPYFSAMLTASVWSRVTSTVQLASVRS